MHANNLVFFNSLSSPPKLCPNISFFFPSYLVCLFSCAGNLGNADTAGVGSQDSFRFANRVEILENGSLDVYIFRCGLDNKVHIVQRRQGVGSRDKFTCDLSMLGSNLLLCDILLQQFVYPSN